MMNQARGVSSWRVVALPVAVYVLSFVLPVERGTKLVGGHLLLGGGHEEPYTVYGYEYFIMTAQMLTVGIPFWLANPAFWLGVWFYLRGRRHHARIAALVGLALGLGAGLVHSFNESEGLSIAYPVWISSFFLLLGLCFLGRLDAPMSLEKNPTQSRDLS